MTFTESNTVERMILDAGTQRGGTPTSMVHWNTSPGKAPHIGCQNSLLFTLILCALPSSIHSPGLTRLA
jgi:hypothetical protein